MYLLIWTHTQPVEHGDLRLTVLEAKSTVKIGEPYTFKCRLINTSERSMDLHLLLNTVSKLGCGYTGSLEFMVSADETRPTQFACKQHIKGLTRVASLK